MLAHHIKISFYKTLQQHICSATPSHYLRSRAVPALIKTSKICYLHTNYNKSLAGISDCLSKAIFYFYQKDPVLLSTYKDGIERVPVQNSNEEGSCIHLLWRTHLIDSYTGKNSL